MFDNSDKSRAVQEDGLAGTTASSRSSITKCRGTTYDNLTQDNTGISMSSMIFSIIWTNCSNYESPGNRAYMCEFVYCPWTIGLYNNYILSK